MSVSNLLIDLKGIVGERVTTREYERWFYERDIVHLPSAVKSLFKSNPEAIVKPITAEQIVEIVSYCSRRGIPLTARGGGSSGLFAAVPKKGGLVIDMMDMDTIHNIDYVKQTVTVGAGATWWELETSLRRQGLTLLSYPSSARSATVAGWVMTSGLGIGSFKYGSVFEQVKSMQVVHGDSVIKDYATGSGMYKLFETEGTLGIITKLTLKVRPIPERIKHRLLYFTDIYQLFKVIKQLSESPLSIYNMEFFDDVYLSMLKQGGYPTPDFSVGSGLLLVTIDGASDDISNNENIFAGVVKEWGAVEEQGAEEHWRERFKILRVRRAVSDLILSSVYVPIPNLGQMYRGLKRLKRHPLALLGYVTSKSECNLMPLMPTDASHPVPYLFALHTPSDVSNLAISLDGKPGGGVGVWNSPYRKDVLGRQRTLEVKELKPALDPKNILNPGILNPPPLFSPVIYQATMAIAGVIDKFMPEPKHVSLNGYQKELASCVQCGNCMNYCPTKLEWMSSTPRGRILASRELFIKHKKPKSYSPESVNRLFQCTMCGRCGVDCSVDIKSRAMWLGTRMNMGKRGLYPESLKELSELVGKNHNIAGRPNELRGNWAGRVKLPFDLNAKKTASVVYFVGCVASFFPMVQPSARAFTGLMAAAGVDFTIVGGEEWCCGFPLLAGGDIEGTRLTFRHNLERMKDIGAKTVVMTCPGCFKTWKEEYKEVMEERHGLSVLHSTEFLSQLVEQKKLSLKKLETVVTYHDPCDLGRNGGIYDEPRFLLKSIPGLNLMEMENSREYCTCCGSGGDLLASNKDLSLSIAAKKLKEIQNTGAKTAVTACPSCIRAITMAKTTEKVKLDVMDITELIWRSLEA